jgi:hypothetical protein
LVSPTHETDSSTTETEALGRGIAVVTIRRKRGFLGRGFGARSGFALTAPATRGTIGLACSRAGRAETLARGGIGRFRRAAR